MSQATKPNTLIGFIIILTILFLIALGPYFNLQQLVTMGLLPSLALIAFFYDVKDITANKREFLVFLLIFFLSFTAVFYYLGYDEYSRSLSSFFGAIVSAYIALGLTKNTNYSTYFHIGYISSVLVLFSIMIKNGNIGLNFASAVDFRDRFMLNANAYSYYCVFANFSLIYLYLKKRSKFLLTLLITLPILFMVITFTTQSRAGLLLVILINLSFWLFINKPKKLSKLKSLGRKFLIGLALALFALQFINIYQGSRIQQRVSQTDTKKDPRELLVKEGLEVFSENPIIGVGLGQFPLYSKYGLFTHNSYTEILAEQGIVGGILLLILYLIPTLQSFRNYRNDPENPFFKFYLTFFIIFLLYNNAYVFYKFPFSMMYFFLIISLQKRCTTYFNRKGLNIN